MDLYPIPETKGEKRILKTGCSNGYSYYIAAYGGSPEVTIYMRKKHPLYKTLVPDILDQAEWRRSIPTHTSSVTNPDGRWIGWSYSGPEDYVRGRNETGYKHTEEDVTIDIEAVIRCLKKNEKKALDPLVKGVNASQEEMARKIDEIIEYINSKMP